MWQNIIVAVIVALALLYVGRMYYRKAKGKSGCGCGCSSCSGEPHEKAASGVKHTLPPCCQGKKDA